MPMVSSDWSVTQSTKVIDYIGDDHGGASPSYATVLEFHRKLQEWGTSDTIVGDDEVAIFYDNPSDKSFANLVTLLNGYTITDAAAEHLYDGSIIQGSGGTEKIWDGLVNFGNPDVQIQLIQNGAVLPDDFWNVGGAGINPDATQGISHRFMVLVRDSGADIDGRRLVGTARRFGKTFSEFPINGGTNRGNNTLALKDVTDENNSKALGTVAAMTDIVNVKEGFSQLDIDNNSSPEDYYSQWDLGARSENDFYERAKWLTREGSTETIYGLNGELFRGITHEIDITPSAGLGNWTEPEAVSWSTGSGQLLAVNDVDETATTKMWIQLLTGVAPTSEVITGGTSGATGTASAATERPISTPFSGQTTGTAIRGAYGLGFQVGDVGADARVVDLTEATISPPNNVSFGVGNLEVGESTVLVGPWDSPNLNVEGHPIIDKTQLSLNTPLTGAAETEVVVTAIPSDTPNTGSLVILLDSGLEVVVPYTSWSGNTFQIASTDFSGDNATTTLWIAYILKVATATTESYTAIHSVDRDLVIIVRGSVASPTKEFRAPATFVGSNTVVNAVLNSDA